MTSTWFVDTPRVPGHQKYLGENLFTHSHVTQMCSGLKPDNMNPAIQSTPLIHTNGKGRGSYTGIETALELGSPLIGHSPVVDEGYFSSLSSQSTTAHISRDAEDDKLSINPNTTAAHLGRHFGNSRSGGSFSLTGTPSAFSTVRSHDLNSHLQPEAQANSFWTALASLRQQLNQTSQPLQSTMLHPLLFGQVANSTTAMNAGSVSSMNYLPNPLLLPMEQTNRYPLFIPPYNMEHHLIRPESNGTLCERMVAKVRREMLNLVETSMKQLESYLLQGNTISDHNKQPSVNTVDVQSSTLPPLSTQTIRETPIPAYPLSRPSQSNAVGSQATDRLQDTCSKSVGTGAGCITPSKCATRLFSRNRSVQPPQPPHPMIKRRRLRIRSSARRLRIKQMGTGTCDRQSNQSPGSSVDHSIRRPDETLDLRVRRGWPYSNLRSENEDWKGSRLADGSFSHHSMDKSEHSEVSKTLTLTGTHLKRAKLMFLYARYPSSSVLKTFFPEVIFTRSTTAQMVKWFSNFREFFYIQIEKFARQYKAEGLKTKESVLISREHELFRTLELHYNKDREIETPNEFLYATQAAVNEFIQAVCSGADRDVSWKKSIYKVIAPMDVPFPDCLKTMQLI